jgi:hypothetical protein
LSADPAHYRERPLDRSQRSRRIGVLKHHIHLEDERMNESIMNFEVEDGILSYDVADEAVEAAAGLLEGQAKSVTVAFCSGLDTCPS